MRFRVRTLMIVVTVAGFYFGWVAYARKQATSHRQIAGAIAHRLAQTTRLFNDTEAMHRIQSLAAGRSVTRITYHEDLRRRGRVAVIENGPNARVVSEETAVDWRDAIHHAMLADAYDRAIYRPWVMFGIRSSDR
jgi:hypothetical protein